ncbi:M48 family metalloprotease, partial [bacterium]|nr:M48 family metalloprotease [bacterium]
QSGQGYGQPPYGSTQSGQGYGQPPYGANTGMPQAPPDIGNAPPPYEQQSNPAQQQTQIIANSRPLKIEPGPIAIPADFSRRPLIGVIQLDDKGRLRREALHLDNAGQLSSSSLLTDSNSLLAPNLSARLSPQDAKALLDNPDALLSSRYAANFLNCQRVLILPSKSQSDYYGTDIDLRTLSRHKIYPSHSGSQAEMNAEIVAQALSSASQANTPVIASQYSYKYHRTDADHLSASSSKTEYPNPAAAKQAGLRPCPLCFPETEYQDVNNGSLSSAAVPDELPLSQHTEMAERLSAVAVQIAYANKLSPQTYRVYLLADPDYKAFSYVGGPVLLSEGLLNVLDTPGEVAAAVAHEMAHLSLGHVTLKPQSQQKNEQNQQGNRRGGGFGSFLGSMVSSAVGSAVAYSTGNYWAGWGARKAIDIGSNLKITFPKHHEEAADRQAIIMCFKAGYSPEDYVLTINKLGSLYQQRKDNEWLKEHGKSEDRLRNIRGLVGQLSAVELDLRTWNDDPTLCAAWRQQAQRCIDKPSEFQDFSAAYKNAKAAI